MTNWPRIQAALEADDVVILPTETVYGLAARADSEVAVSKIYDIKGRDFDKPLAVCVKDVGQAERLAYFNDTAHNLAKRHWPGSLTLVLDASEGAKLDPRVMQQTDQGPTIALRCPEADWVEHLEFPIALTSANKSGEADCTTFDEAMTQLGDQVAAGLGTDAPLSGSPSTIIRVSGDTMTILRQGALVVTEVSS